MMLFNPTKEVMNRTISLPLYYTGLTQQAIITDQNGVRKILKLNRDYSTSFTFTIPADTYAWYVIE